MNRVSLVACESCELTTLAGFADRSCDRDPDADDLVTGQIDEGVEEVEFEAVSR